MHTNLTILFIASLLLASCGGILYTPPTAAEHCGIDPALLEPETADKTLLSLWATAERQYCWRAYAPLLTAHQRPELLLSVDVSNLEINEEPLTDQLMALAADHEAPDIAFVFHHQAVRLGEAGHLYSLNECRHYPEFDSIPEAFWTGFSADGQAWGIPVDMEVMLLYYNKKLLRQLGWMPSQIEQLPARTLSGDFTIQDLVATATEAVEKGIIKPGMAFMPHRSQGKSIESIYLDAGGKFSDEKRSNLVVNLEAIETSYSFLASLAKHQLLDTRLAIPSFDDWGNKLLMRDGAIHDRYLFWHTYSSGFPRMALDYMDKPSNTALLNQQIGVALLPSHAKERPGHSLLINSGQYVIFSQNATGRNYQEMACKLLAATQESGLYKQHTPKSGHLTFFTDGFVLPEWLPPQISLDVLIWTPPHLPKIDEYRNTLTEMGMRVESGELTARDAADKTVERLRDVLGSQLIVE